MRITASPITDVSEATQILNRGERSTRSIGPGVLLRQRYRLENELGRGGMGVVYRATDIELKRPVAVKGLSAAAPPDARERLLREARAAAALNHPHIVSVHDVGESDGIPFFVMEFVQGPSLAKAPPTKLSEIVEIASQ